MPKKYTGTAADDTIHGSWWDDLIYGMDGDDTLYGEGGIDQLFGGIGNDTLIGGAGDDLLMGGTGADTLQGGSGIDTASYSRSSAAVLVSLEANKTSGGDAAGDTLNGVENLTGSIYDDGLYGNDVANVLIGSGGDDYLSGQDGDDTLDGGHGDDWFNGGDGADALDGGAGVDTAMFSGSQAGVFVDLLTGQGYGGSAEGDTLWSIENLHGSTFDDALIGNFADNRLTGGGGTDTLIGGDGADHFAFGGKAGHFKYADGLGTAADTVSDFNALQGDKIDVSAVGHIYPKSDLLTCTFIGESEFTGVAGEVRYEQIGTNTWISCDRNGDASADFQIKCEGTIAFTANDFIL
jgi:Ca2+-binding RTX toxin-like protein